MKKEEREVKIKKDKNEREHVCGISLDKFPAWYVCHHNGILRGVRISTICLERRGMILLKKCLASNLTNDILLQNEIKNFIQEVLWWGVKSGRREYWFKAIFSRQPQAVVADKICKAATFLQKDKLALAIETLDNSQKRGVKGMRFTVGSKVLRMMSPGKAGALDRILRAELPKYAKSINDYAGYAEFCKHCKKVANDLLKKHGIQHPLRKKGNWLASDVESVLFAHFNSDFSLEGKRPCPFCKKLTC